MNGYFPVECVICPTYSKGGTSKMKTHCQKHQYIVKRLLNKYFLEISNILRSGSSPEYLLSNTAHY